MTPAARLIAVVVGLVGLLFAAAGMVREVVLAAQGATDWPLSTWWGSLTGEPSATATVAAVLAGLLTLALLLLAVRQLGGRGEQSAVQVGGDQVGAEEGRAHGLRRPTPEGRAAPRRCPRQRLRPSVSRVGQR